MLLTLLVLVLVAASVYVSVQRPADDRRAASARIEAEALARGRVTLIARAGADANRPGSLSCPDLDGNQSAGEGNPPNCTDRLGRFPNQTYAIERLRDSTGERIWYAIAEGVRDQGTVKVNPDTVVPFEIDGDEGYAAAVIVPGAALSGQDRSSANEDDSAQYLERPEGGASDNAAGPPFIDCGGRDNCNDRVRGVTIAELFDLPQRRVLAAVERLLRDFYADNGYLPYAADFGTEECDGTAKRTFGQLPFADSDGDCGGVLDKSDLASDEQWIEENEWLPFVVYRVDDDCAGTGAACLNAGLQIGSTDDLQVVLAAAGRVRAGQTRVAPAGVTDYLDSPINTDADDTEFDDARPTPADNDSLRGFSVQ